MKSLRGFANVVGLELRRGLKGASLWSLLLFGLVVMGLAFFPALSGSFGELEGLFANPMMSGVLTAFGADVDALTSLAGFYVTYASIYVTLLGCVYGGIVGARILVDDEASGLAEYLLTRPVSRTVVYCAKVAAAALLIAGVNLVVVAGSIFGLEMFGSSAPLTVHADRVGVERIAAAATRNPSAFREVVGTDDELFDRVAVALARNELAAASPAEMRAAGVESQAVEAVVGRLEALGPEGLIEDVENHPERYAAIFSEETSSDEIRSGARQLRSELASLRNAFDAGGPAIGEMFRAAPTPFLRRMAAASPTAHTTPSADGAAEEGGGRERRGGESAANAAGAEVAGGELSRDALRESLGRIGVDTDTGRRLLIRYPRDGIAVLSVYNALAMLLFACVGLLASSLARKPETAVGVALGVVFVAYFVDVISQAVGSTGLAPASPFAMIDQNIADPEYGFRGAVVLYFIGVSVVAALAGLGVFRGKDIHVP